jgi:hypothetical protein
MIPYLIQDAVLNNNHAVNALIDLVIQEIESTQNKSSSATRLVENDPRFNTNNTETCGTLFDITKFIPLWVIKEKTEREGNGETVLTIYDFLQKYYDWLYCDNSTGGQYGLSNNILDLIDIRKTKENLIQNLYAVYAESFTGIFDSSSLTVGRSELEKFFIGIRKNFYHRKGTEDGIRKLLTTLFVIDEADIEIEIPKQFILRLNGGKFADSNFTFRTGTGDTGSYLEKGDLSGSYLNFSKFHDTTWFHDYSYLVFVGSNYNDNDDLEQVYRASNHPAGTHLIFGKQLSDFQPAEPDDEVGTICEYPMLSNYAPYRLNVTYGSLGTINGYTFYGITSCVGCCGASYSGFTGPTHRFPNWNQLITEDTFGNINIQDFIILCYADGFTSPNENLSCTGCN